MKTFSSGRAVRALLLALALGAATVGAHAAAAGNLDELLEQTRTAREAEAKANAAREARFLAERNKQVAQRIAVNKGVRSKPDLTLPPVLCAAAKRSEADFIKPRRERKFLFRRSGNIRASTTSRVIN